jgi:hypothetical protein
MTAPKEMMYKDEAFRQMKSMITRTAWLHYAFAKTIIDELGEEKGKELVKKAIRLYGELVGKRAQKRAVERGLPNRAENFQDDLPSLGWHHREWVEIEGEKRARVHTCYLAETWKELGEEGLGRLYCFVDQAKYEAFNSDLVCVHTQNVLSGDPFCELAVRKKKT